MFVFGILAVAPTEEGGVAGYLGNLVAARVVSIFGGGVGGVRGAELK